MSPRRPRISVVLPTYQRWPSLARTLDGLGNQTYPRDRFEVVVIDDGSGDGRSASIAQSPRPYQMQVLSQERQGPAAARNLGLQRAQGEIILFLDDDVVPSPGLLAEHEAVHDEDPRAVVVGPMLPPQNGGRAPWVRWEEVVLQKQHRDMLSGRYGPTPRQFYTANASVRRRHLDQVGGFDPSFQRAEDVELAYRLRDLGLTFYFSPGAAVIHDARRSFHSWRDVPYWYGRYDVVMFRTKGRSHILPVISREFYERHRLTQLLARLCVGRGLIRKGALGALSTLGLAAGLTGAERISLAAYSGIFNVLYWQGVCDELKSTAEFWRWISKPSLEEAAGSVPGKER